MKIEKKEDYRAKAHHMLDRLRSESIIHYLYELMVSFSVRWEGGGQDE